MITENAALLGRRGEDVAVHFLCARGYQIRERNFRIRGGEIDIIAEIDGAIIFAEVKTRCNKGFARAADAVDAAKQKRIIKTAMTYLAKNKLGECPCRFDVLEVYKKPNELFEIEHIRDAFEIEG